MNEWMLKCRVSTLCGWIDDFIPTIGTHYQEIQPDWEIFILKSWWVEYKGKCVFLWLLFLFMRCVSRRFARCFLSLFINRESGSILWCLFSRKERSVSLNFPGHLHQTAVRQPSHLGSFDLEKYLQQTFSVAKKSTDFLKFFSLLNSWMERTKDEMPHNWFFWICHDLARMDRLLRSPSPGPRRDTLWMDLPDQCWLLMLRGRGNQEAVGR